MNRPPDVELVLRSYLADTGDRAPDRVLEDVAARIARQPRGRTWRLSGRPFMNTYAKLGIAAAAMVMVAVAGYAILPMTPGPGTPTPSPTAAPTPSPTAAAVPSPTPGSGLLPSGRLAAGHYTFTENPEFPGLQIAADVPAGWLGYPEIPALLSPTQGANGALIGFMKADSLFSDPCQWDVDGSGAESQPGDVEFGPTVDDLVNAIGANTAYTSSTPSPLNLGGYVGAQIELRLPGQDVLDTCDVSTNDPGDGKYLPFPNGFWAQGPNNIWRLFIVDVDGTRVITMLNYFDDVPQADVDAGQAIIESFVITP